MMTPDEASVFIEHPGKTGIYKFQRTESGKLVPGDCFRKWDGLVWYCSSSPYKSDELEIKEALKEKTPIGTQEAMKKSLIFGRLVEYVCDLHGRRPAPEPEQLFLFQ